MAPVTGIRQAFDRFTLRCSECQIEESFARSSGWEHLYNRFLKQHKHASAAADQLEGRADAVSRCALDGTVAPPEHVAVFQSQGRGASSSEAPATMDNACDPLLEHPTRQRLIDLISRSWGICEQELGRATQLGRNNIKYHLYKLNRFGLVQVLRHGRKNHYFPQDMPAKDVQRAIAIVQSDTLRDVAAILKARPDLSWRAMSAQLGITPRGFRYHVERLQESGLLVVDRTNRRYRTRFSASLEQALAGPTTNALSSARVGIAPTVSSAEPKALAASQA